ncbi:MAG: tRNA (adenosine(37)-N6)-dimethylallyltransferase MiaA [Sulfurovum sp.]|nr:tRNA (adenosine(37)-N6)-dimethylallyltransferase MiaA [Sulfurovum sp.]
MTSFKQLALIGPTASGKTALSIKVAQKMNAYILSLDSLAIYKEIDIVSAKPTVDDRAGVLHFGIDEISPSEAFDVANYIKLYHSVYARCLEEGKNLVIVGGTSFYLKMLIDGISEVPLISENTTKKTTLALLNLTQAHAFLTKIDENYMSKIETKDSYRIEKALNIYFETGFSPTEYFQQNPPQPTITEPLPIYQIVWERELLRERIMLRTKMMVDEGLIDEICFLEKKYSRLPNCMKSIGIKETLAYLDGVYDKEVLIEKIATNTARLAKRQTTFNNSQFEDVIKGSVEELEKILLN